MYSIPEIICIDLVQIIQQMSSKWPIIWIIITTIPYAIIIQHNDILLYYRGRQRNRNYQFPAGSNSDYDALYLGSGNALHWWVITIIFNETQDQCTCRM